MWKPTIFSSFGFCHEYDNVVRKRSGISKFDTDISAWKHDWVDAVHKNKRMRRQWQNWIHLSRVLDFTLLYFILFFCCIKCLSFQNCGTGDTWSTECEWRNEWSRRQGQTAWSTTNGEETKRTHKIRICIVGMKRACFRNLRSLSSNRMYILSGRRRLLVVVVIVHLPQCRPFSLLAHHLLFCICYVYMAFICSSLRSFHMILLFIHVISVVRVRDSSIRQSDRRTRIHHTKRSTMPRERKREIQGKRVGQPAVERANGKENKKRGWNSFIGFSGKLFAVRVRAIISGNFYQTKRISVFFGPFIRSVCKTEELDWARASVGDKIYRFKCELRTMWFSCMSELECAFTLTSMFDQSRRLTGTFESISATITTIDWPNVCLRYCRLCACACVFVVRHANEQNEWRNAFHSIFSSCSRHINWTI